MHRTLQIEDTLYTIPQLERLPLEAAQVALAGRSNVGKSSLINCLGGAKKLAKISSTPGKTRSINLFKVHPADYYLVDLPGYGYARCSKTERAKWANLIEQYLSGTPGLKAVAVLIDSRLEPQQLDIEMTAYVNQLGLQLLPVLTKADKCKQRDLAKRQEQWKNLLRIDRKPLIFSSKTGRGREPLWNLFDEACGYTPPQPEEKEQKTD